jgi:hypothetical protein
MTLRPVLVGLLWCSGTFGQEAAQMTGATSFAPRPLTLTPDTPPEIPAPEKSWGIPLPEHLSLAAEAAEARLEPTPEEWENIRTAKLWEMFEAVSDGDTEKVRSLLAAGVNVNSELPRPPRAEFAARFRGNVLHYFVTVERGLTPLMLASGLGQRDMSRLLLENGADPHARTKRHKTFALWLAGKGRHVEIMQMLLGVKPDSDAARLAIEIDLSSQTARLLRDGVAGPAMPVSTGRPGFPTPPGDYVVTDKHRKWRSTIYPADMPFFMRLSCGEFGLHAGALPGYPASHGCIRLHRQDAEDLFKHVPVGTRVTIK